MTPLRSYFSKKMNNFAIDFLVEPVEIVLEGSTKFRLQFIHVQPHNSDKYITYYTFYSAKIRHFCANLIMGARRGGGKAGIGVRSPPPRKSEILFCYMVAFSSFFLMGVFLATFFASFFFMGGGWGFFSMCGPFCSLFSLWGPISLCGGLFLSLPPPPPPTKISAGAHGSNIKHNLKNRLSL